jgi:hypothetical protein
MDGEEPLMEFRRLTVPAARLDGWLAGFAERHGVPQADAGPDLVELTAPDESVARVHVPFPPLASASSDQVSALVAHANAERTVGVLLVRRGGHAVGVFVGERLIRSKVGSRHVQGTTKAGGWSQQRFARRRANQAQQAFAAAADAAVEVLADMEFDAVVCGGDRAAVRSVLADRRLEGIAGRVVEEPFLAVPDPRLRVLTATPRQFLAVRIDIAP